MAANIGEKSFVEVGGIRMRVGIDISHFNDVVDWERLVKDGYQFVIIKSSQGYAYADDMFKIHRDNAIQAGLPWGFYHFYDYRYPDGTTQANWAIQCVGDAFGQIAPCVDFETQYQNVKVNGKWKKKEIPKPPRNTCYSELMELGYALKKKYGVNPKLYIGNLLPWLKPDAEMVALFDLWLAQWNSIVSVSLNGFPDWQVWQRIGDIQLDGQTGAWDINYVRDSDYPDLIGQSVITEPVPTETLTIDRKVDLLWTAHPELHPAS